MTLYTIGCPQCKVLEKKMAQKNIAFEICDDRDVMREKNMKSAPMLELDNGTILNFTQAVAWLKEQD